MVPPRPHTCRCFRHYVSSNVAVVFLTQSRYLMGLKDDFAEAREWVATGLNMDQSIDVNLFEV